MPQHWAFVPTSTMQIHRMHKEMQLCVAHSAAGWRLAPSAHISHPLCAAKAGTTAMSAKFCSAAMLEAHQTRGSSTGGHHAPQLCMLFGLVTVCSNSVCPTCCHRHHQQICGSRCPWGTACSSAATGGTRQPSMVSSAGLCVIPSSSARARHDVIHCITPAKLQGFSTRRITDALTGSGRSLIAPSSCLCRGLAIWAASGRGTTGRVMIIDDLGPGSGVGQHEAAYQNHWSHRLRHRRYLCMINGTCARFC
jgi:hypothetical protein